MPKGVPSGTKTRYVTIARQVFSVFDLVILILIATIGLVWARLLFIFAFITSACLETFAAFGYASSTLLGAMSVWTALYAISALCAIFIVTILLTQRETHWVVLVFRTISAVAFIILTLFFRSLSLPYAPVLPDQTMIGVSPFQDDRIVLIKPETAPDLLMEDTYFYISRACIDVQTNELITGRAKSNAHSLFNQRWDIWMKRGGMMEHLIAQQSRVSLQGLDVYMPDRSGVSPETGLGSD